MYEEKTGITIGRSQKTRLVIPAAIVSDFPLCWESLVILSIWFGHIGYD